MESLESLRERKRQLERELENITIKKHGSTQWAPGVYDQHKSESYSYKEYTDPGKAMRLQDDISYLDKQIKTYAERAKAERERAEWLKESEIQKYDYVVAGKSEKTENPAIAARYDAQHRFFKMSKVQQTMAKMTGQKKKFEELWAKASTRNPQTQEQVAEELNKMFR